MLPAMFPNWLEKGVPGAMRGGGAEKRGGRRIEEAEGTAQTKMTDPRILAKSADSCRGSPGLTGERIGRRKRLGCVGRRRENNLDSNQRTVPLVQTNGN